MTYLIASLAVETGIAPQDLIELDSQVFNAMIQVLKDRAQEIQNASRGKRSR
jgi:hypothetical protein